MVSYFHAIQRALQLFSLYEDLLAFLVAAGVMVLLTLVHELAHIVAIRFFSGTGKLVLFPFRKEPGLLKWFVVAACDLPDDVASGLPRWKLAVVILAGPLFDVLATASIAAYWQSFEGLLGVGMAYGGGVRLFLSFLNVIPIKALRNDGSRLCILYGWLK